MRVLLITTSRADYGIYASLLRALAGDPDTELGLVVGGTHLSREHGYTVEAIERDGYEIVARVPTVPNEDSAAGVAAMIGEATTSFAEVWNRERYNTDWVIALGDRYEMFSAVAATVPFNLPVVHLHGGETSLGAIDDKFRHAITAMSSLHFTSTEVYADRVRNIIGKNEGVFHVGAPALDGLEEMKLYTVAELQEIFGTDFSKPTILVTFHPETVAVEKNESYAQDLCEALDTLASKYQIMITLPNADTLGSLLRNRFTDLAKNNPAVTTIESFGKKGYFSAMLHCAFLLGNTSSGLIEAPSFHKYALNLGARQEGRMRSGNVFDVVPQRDAILAAVAAVEAKGYAYTGNNIYRGSATAADIILEKMKQLS